MIEKFSNGQFPNDTYNAYQETIDFKDASPNTVREEVLNTELERLQAKDKVIHPYYVTKKRQDAQKRSETLRTRAYYRMIGVFFGMVIIVVGLFVFKKYFPILPDWVYDWLLILVIAGGIIWLFMMQVDISKRDLTDFEKIDFGLLVDVEKVKEKKTDVTSLTGIVTSENKDDCVGKDCCPSGHYFVNNQCTPNPPSPSAQESFTTNSLDNKKNIKPFSPLPSFSGY